MSGREGGRQGRGRGRGQQGGGPPPGRGRGRGQQGGGRGGGGSRGGGDRGSGRGSGEPVGGLQYVPSQPRQQPQQVAASRPTPPPPRQPQQPQQPQHPHPPEGASSSSSPIQSVTRQIEKSLSLSASDLPSATERVEAASSSSTALTGPAPPISPQLASLRPPLRPGFGKAGQVCRVRANHFLVQLSNKNMEMYHYDVAITPEVTSRAVNRDILNQLVRLYGESHLAKRMPAYDGRKNLYTAGPLPFASKEFAIKLIEKDDKNAVRKEREFKVAIKFAIKTDLYQLQEFLRGKLLDSPQDTIQLLDVVLRGTPSNNYTTVARSFFSTTFGPAERVENGVECWRGYYQSLRPTQMGLSLNIDLSATSFYEPLNVIDFIAQYLNQNLSRPLSDVEWVKIKKVLRGVKVETTHRPDVRARYRITGLSSVSANQLEFVGADGTKTTVAQYFRATYRVSLRFASWPCLLAGSSTKPAYLPLEVCKIVPGQRYTKKLNEKQVSKILKMTCKRPFERENGIAEMVKKNNYAGDPLVKEFGIQVINNLTSVEARILPPPLLKYHDSGREKSCQPRVGQWNMINKKMVDGSNVHLWACLNFSNVPPNAVDNFCYELIGMCSNMGMSFNPNPVFGIDSAQPHKIEEALVRLHKNCLQKLPPGQHLQLLIVILPDRSGSYGKIKKTCETELGMVSQCCQPRNVMRCNKQYLENVALKINVKCGGRNTVLNDVMTRKLPAITSSPCIIFGADVTHPQPGEDSQSIAAVVASMDWPEITKYRGLVSAQRSREEIIHDLYTSTVHPEKGVIHGGMIRELLLAYYRSTKCKPNRIIFYRDGVSEGQFNSVLLHEMDAIRKACASLEIGYLPPVTFVVVQKRHHTRLFPVDQNLTDRSGNIVPGTVVDTSICHPSEFDFYLCSHAGIQGTSRPTHYHVLYDENKFSADGLQNLTYNLCYTYARCTRSVSIVPPAYYAHLAAFRARYYMEDSYSAPSDSVGARERAVVVALPQIKDNVKNVMFFC